MANATAQSIASASPTIRPEEAAHFGKLAADWWNPKGSSAMLHRLNPVRLGFIRDAIDRHFAVSSRSFRPLDGKRALDVGCGAGLLAEPLARLGATVTGIDAAGENIAAAADHATGAGLAITYIHGDLAECAPGQFDLVTALEVIEHVADKRAFMAALAGALAPGGLLVMSTPNRTVRSRLLLVEAAEASGAIPRGTHHWADFVTPDELAELMAGAGLEMDPPTGIAWSPARGLHLGEDRSLNYIVTATRTI